MSVQKSPEAATNQIEYKGFVASVEIDSAANLLHARVFNIKSHVLSACGRTVRELEKSLEETVEIYLADCAEDGDDAQQPEVVAIETLSVKS